MFLNVHSTYSLRYGTMNISCIIEEARKNNIHELVLTDINNSTGAMEFIRSCRKEKLDKFDENGTLIQSGYDLKPIIGIEFRRDMECLYIGIAKNKEGMKALNDFLTHHNLTQTPLPDYPIDCLDTYFVFPFNRRQFALKPNCYIGIRPNELHLLYGIEKQEIGDKLVVLQPVTCKDKLSYRLHKYLRAIDLNTLFSKLKQTDIGEESDCFMNIQNLVNHYEAHPKILKNTQRLLDACSMDEYQFGKKNKKTFTGNKKDDFELLSKLAIDGLTYRYGAHNTLALERLKKELKVIKELNFCTYFLITWDITQYSTSKGYYHVGRGSGANSMVAYCLKITDVDPLDLDLYFERFLNHKRTSPPDFDIDYSWDERSDVQDYIFQRYGRSHTALLGTMTTFKERSIIREIGKVLGITKAEIDSFTDPRNTDSNNKNEIFKKIAAILSYLKGFPNQRSIHAGGILIGEEPITYYTALDLPPKGMPTVQWDMYEAEAIGLDKFDILSQRGIGHIREAVKLVQQNKNIKIDIHDFKTFKNDQNLNNKLKTADAIGCFYIESPAMRQLLQKLRCENYLTLVAASSIIRPGVASSGMMKMYIQNYHSPKTVQYLHPVMKEQLEETFGVMVYQEDVIKICHHYAGLDHADADILRRGMSGKYRSREEFDKLVARFFKRAAEIGRDEVVTKEVWRQVSSFAGYSFSKAHSASFAVESYQSLYLKTYFPMEFMVAVLNNYGGFYQRWVYVYQLQKTGALVQLPCVNESDEVINIKNNTCWIGFIGILGLESKYSSIIPQLRKEGGKFTSLENFIQRTGISLDQVCILIRIGAFRFTKKTKKELFWEVHSYLGNKNKTLPDLGMFSVKIRTFKLPEFESNLLEDAYQELEILGYPISLSFFDLLETKYRGDLLALNLPDYVGKFVKMVGNYVCEKSVHTVKNTRMWFGTFLDLEGNFFDTIHFPNTTPIYPFRGSGCYLIYGKVVEDFEVTGIEVVKFFKLPIKKNPALL